MTPGTHETPTEPAGPGADGGATVVSENAGVTVHAVVRIRVCPGEILVVATAEEPGVMTDTGVCDSTEGTADMFLIATAKQENPGVIAAK